MSTIQSQGTLFPGRPIPSETVEDIITRVAATANAEDVALVARLTAKEAPRHYELGVEVTPAAAALILRDHDSANRELTLPKAQKYARIMDRGAWPVTKDVIAFDVNGKVCDGQHRFLAVAIFGSPVKLDVCIGEALSAREFYDNGTPRSAADILHMHGTDDVSLRQTMVKTAVSYQRKLKKEPTVPMDRAEIVEQAETHAHALATAIGIARNSLQKPQDQTQPHESCMNLNTAASVAYLLILGGWQSGEVGAFVSTLQVGIGEGDNHPITIAATLLLRDKRFKTKERLNMNQKISIALQANWLWRMNKRQPIRKPTDLITYMRPAELRPDPMGDGIPLPPSPLTQ